MSLRFTAFAAFRHFRTRSVFDTAAYCAVQFRHRGYVTDDSPPQPAVNPAGFPP